MPQIIQMVIFFKNEACYHSYHMGHRLEYLFNNVHFLQSLSIFCTYEYIHDANSGQVSIWSFVYIHSGLSYLCFVWKKRYLENTDTRLYHVADIDQTKEKGPLELFCLLLKMSTTGVMLGQKYYTIKLYTPVHNTKME